MTAPDLPGPWPDVLAAYADGELGPDDRAAVERWLAAHPAARAELCTQLQLSPENWRLWQCAEPPLPSEDTWAAVQDAVVAGATAEPATPAVVGERRGAAWWKRSGVWLGIPAAVVAAAVLVAAGLTIGPALWRGDPAKPAPPEVAGQRDDPLRDYAVLPIVGEQDVDVRRVEGNGGGWLPVGAHPLPGPLVLADADDVELEGADPHPAWPSGAPQITRRPGDAPMIFAANLR